MNDTPHAARLLATLADPTRLSLIRLLSRQTKDTPLCVGALARRLGVSQPAVSQHIRVLKEAGLVQGDKGGNRVHYYLDPEAVKALNALTNEILSLPADGEPCREEC